jgi:3-carboxy-cis,cis-muconate cycloisomerase
MTLLSPLFRSESVEHVFSDRATLQGMLDFEAALARAEEKAGVIPVGTAKSIGASCHAKLFDFAAIGNATASAGNLAIPLIKQLTAQVAKSDEAAAQFVHWGATSQDAIDTGRVLQLRGALKLLSNDLENIAATLATLAEKHRATLMVGRTWMQHALPTTFGVRVTGWLDAIERQIQRLEECSAHCLVLQFGGAVGTLAALGERGTEVANTLGAELNLPVPSIPWHSHRDRMAEIAGVAGNCVGTLGKIAKDISLHSQTEIAELLEPAGKGRGGSSTMPQKRNPVTCAVVLSAAQRVPGLVSTMLSAMVQEDERGLGGWHSEWETLPEIIGLTAGAAHHFAIMLPDLEIDTNRMRDNLDVTHGLIFAEAVTMALGEKIGRVHAHEVVEAACIRARLEKQNLKNILLHDQTVGASLSPHDLDRLFDARQYLGASNIFIDQVLEKSKARQQRQIKK